jgi:pristinamycin I synthase-3/4
MGEVRQESKAQKRSAASLDSHHHCVSLPETPVSQMFEEQVKRTPDAIAIASENTDLTYEALDKKANQIAQHLIGQGVSTGSIIGVALNHSIELVYTLLGVLKAGGAYLPLDPHYPMERLKHILADARPNYLITTEEISGSLQGLTPTVPTLYVDDTGNLPSKREYPSYPILPKSLAYVIYTSGSTGKPKGVAITHQALSNFMQAMIKQFEVHEKDVIFSTTSTSFDIAGLEIYLPLLTGAKLQIIPRAVTLDGYQLSQRIAHFKPTLMQGTPALWQLLREAGWLPEKSMKILCGGEALPADLGEFLCATSKRVWNMYGPTETTIWSLLSQVHFGAAISIGRPILNTQIYVLDNTLQRVPTGVAGELYIAGDGLAQGYLRQPGLTSQRFVACPFGTAGRRMYRTGDLVRWNKNGNLEFLERVDEQIKIRGFRIEPKEIEAVLIQYPAVTQAKVILQENPIGQKLLVGYVISSAETTVDSLTLRRYLREYLPEYMIPSTIIKLEKFPLTPNGKLDRKALPPLEFRLNKLELPKTSEEKTLARLFAATLGLTQVGTRDNFFDLGGNSLLATRLISQIRVALNIELPIRIVFECPTVAGLAKKLNEPLNERGIARLSLQPMPRPESIPLSFSQQRLWFLYQLEGPSATYNIPIAIRLQGNLDIEALQASLNYLLTRHETLRTRFRKGDHGGEQEVLSSKTVLKLNIYQTNERELPKKLSNAADYHFDLCQDLPIQVSLFKFGERQQVLLLCIHHIASDGWSLAPLLQDLSMAYTASKHGKAIQQSPLPIQFIDYTLWQRQMLGRESDPESPITQQLNYWRKTLTDLPEQLNLPFDRARPAIASFKGEEISFRISPELHSKLLSLAHSEQSSLFMLLQAAFAILLTKLGAGNDIPIGSPIAGRTDVALDDLVGFFVNSLVLRTDTSGNPSVKQLLARIRETNLSAYANQDLPFNHLVEEINPNRTASHHPLFQVMLVLQNNVKPTLNLPGLTTQIEPLSTRTSKFDLTLEFTEQRSLDGYPEGLQGLLEYATDLFDRPSINIFIKRLIHLLDAIVVQPDQPIGNIDILSDEEKQTILKDWNNTHHPLNKASFTQMFEQQVQTTPDAIAIVFEHASLTYSELNLKANQIAHWLIANHIGTEDIVGLSLGRSTELLCGILGILKAGATYLPMDPEYPSERLNFIIQDAKPTYLITTQAVIQNLPISIKSIPRLCLDDPEDVLKLKSLPNNNPTDRDLIRPVLPQSAAYIIYTSGSTGQPKGVVVSHYGIPNLAFNYIRCFGLKEKARFLQFSSINFDATFCEMCCTLLSGATTIFTYSERLLSSETQISLFDQYDPTHITFSPTILGNMPTSVLANCKNLMVAGEMCPKALVKLWAPGRRMINTYGPTEATVDSLYWECEVDSEFEIVPIGRPLWNTQVYVLDSSLKPVPIGVVGELYISGHGLARGYLNRASLTAERFVACPFGQAGDRMYRSGDLVRWRRDGLLEFIGRSDHQIKIRGLRIEPKEIEAVLMEHPLVAQAAVIAREDQPGHKQIIGYVSLQENDVVARDKLGEIEQVQDWQTIHEEDYSQQIDLAHTEDFRGWNSSFDEKPIALDQMREWRENTVKRILALKPQNVLEIGVGSGLILWEVAPECSSYYGIDFSKAVITALSHQVDKDPTLRDRVQLRSLPAHDLMNLPTQFFDTIIINSVIQYFPSAYYLMEVIQQAMDLLIPGGRVYIGDVRNLGLMQNFATTIALRKGLNNIETRQNLQKLIKHTIQLENELLLAPDFFDAIKNEITTITAVDIQLKRGWHYNELTNYRYEVVLHKQSTQTVSMKKAKQILWQPDFLNATVLGNYLDEQRLPYLRLARVPNRRLFVEEKARRIVWNGNCTITMDKLNLDTIANEGAEPELFHVLGNKLGYIVKITWSNTLEQDCFDVIFIDKSFIDDTVVLTDLYLSELPLELEKTAFIEYANAPAAKRASHLAIDLRHYVTQKLPDYMVPATIVILDKLPISPNGKLDQKALPAPDYKSRKIRLPGTITEKLVAKFYIDILGLEEVGLDDRFFDLGGDSIRSIQLVGRMQQAGFSITPRDVFQYQSVEMLAKIAQPIEACIAVSNANSEQRVSNLCNSQKNGSTSSTAKVDQSETLFWQKILKTPDPSLAQALNGITNLSHHDSRNPLKNNNLTPYKTLKITLSARKTAELHRFSNIFHMDCKEMLLIAFSLAIIDWRYQRDNQMNSIIRFDIEPIKVSGEGANVFPIRINSGQANLTLQMADEVAFVRSIKRVKEQLRNIPNQGLNYPSFSRDIQHDPAQVCFSYKQDYTLDSSCEDREFIAAKNREFMALEQANSINHIIRFFLEKTHSKIEAKWFWAESIFCKEEIEKLSLSFLKILESFSHLGQSTTFIGSTHTPSDFTLLSLTQNEIDAITSTYPKIEDILPLSPLQEGLFLQSASFDKAMIDPYQGQTIFDIAGKLNVKRLKIATEALLQRHGNLRAGFIYKGLERPVQVIPEKVALSWSVHDFRKMPKKIQQSQENTLILADNQEHFDLSKAPLLRFNLIRLADERFRLIITDHHILLDGWSMPILLKELFELYRTRGDITLLPRVTPYRAYLVWLQKQDKIAAATAWKDYFLGLEAPSIIAKTRSDAKVPLETYYLILPTSLSDKLVKQANKRGLTLNTLFQTAWAILIAHLAKKTDIVFGVTVSERPADLLGVENMVGLFINTIPLRVKINLSENMAILLNRVQEQQWNLIPHRHLGLTEIQRLSGLGELFDTYYVFQNYPTDIHALGVDLKEIALSQTEDLGAGISHYPLGLTVLPGKPFKLLLGYHPSLFNTETIESIGCLLNDILNYISKNAQQPIGVLLNDLPESQGTNFKEPTPKKREVKDE